MTRNVVSPVSHAAVVSEKLAAGQLQERMVVKGEDEVARLGASFNHMAASLQEQITQLATLSQMQQRFVSDVSHELRTPLTTVRMAAEVLYDARHDFDPINKRSAELLYNQVERFQSLLADLLEISRFDAGVAMLDAEPADILQVITHVIDGAAPVAAEYGSDIILRAPAGRHRGGNGRPPDRPDPAQPHPERGGTRRRAAGDGHRCRQPVSSGSPVRDHGIGMTPAEAARVFDRFWRADPARARTTGGSGLGLSIAMEDTKLHNGWLQAWGMKGSGSSFRLTIPLHQGEEITKSPVQLEPADVACRPGKTPFRPGQILQAADAARTGTPKPTVGAASERAGAAPSAKEEAS